MADSNGVNRRVFVTDANGVEHLIRCKSELDAFLASLPPDQLEAWKLRYRFAPVRNNTGIRDYTGTIRDLL